MSDKISVLLTTYNRAHMLPDAVKSILKQTYTNIELLVYDDGSTDKTLKLLKKYSDGRLRVIAGDKNRGCAHGRNVLMQKAAGKYACWQDSDDWSNIYRVALQYDAIKKGHPIVITTFQWCKTMEKEWRKTPAVKKPSNNTVAHASVMFELDKAISVPLKRSVGGSDADWLRGMKKKYGNYYALEATLYYVRKHNDRIGRWRRGPKANPEWYKRMMKYQK